MATVRGFDSVMGEQKAIIGTSSSGYAVCRSGALCLFAREGNRLSLLLVHFPEAAGGPF